MSSNCCDVNSVPSSRESSTPKFGKFMLLDAAESSGNVAAGTIVFEVLDIPWVPLSYAGGGANWHILAAAFSDSII